MLARAERLLRHHALGGEALYRTVGVRGELVECEVVRAPGLRRGTRITFTAKAVSRMVVIGDPLAEARATRGPEQGPTGRRPIASP